MGLAEFAADVREEVATILASDFTISVTETVSVPHSADGAITFPNLDQKSQGTKLVETTVLYVDMRRSTELSLRHRRHTVARLYSAFVRAMTRCAAEFGGEVRGIIGDRVMVLFEPAKCFGNAIDTAVLMNSVCQYVLNRHFTHGEVRFGIGIDYGQMLATKTGIRRHGNAQQSYRSLVWLGRPANIASKLTDNANKDAEIFNISTLTVAYLVDGQFRYQKEYPYEFVKSFWFDASIGMMRHFNPAFHSFTTQEEAWTRKVETPPILVSKRVYDGFRSERPDAFELTGGSLRAINIAIPEYRDQVYGMDVTFKIFNR